MNLKKLTALILAVLILISQGISFQLQVQAENISLGSEEVEPIEDKAFYKQGKETLAKIIADHAVYALLYKSASAEIKNLPSYTAEAVVNIRVGHQVNLLDVEYVNGETWYLVETMVDGNTYTGYLPDTLLISADEEFCEWRTQWLTQSDNSMFTAEALGTGNTDLSLFPESYRPYIEKLLETHPNWTFVPLDTGLDWNTVMENEMYPARNLVPLETMDTWKVSNDILSAPYWVQASESIIRYYLDPRNFLNEDYVFQFELLSYNSNNHKLSGVKAILKNTFMSDTILEGTDMTYAEAFLKIGKELKISPYHLAGRVRQEQGTEGTSPLISGTYPGYEGLYNYYNIQAAGITYEDIITNGLKEAKEAGWTDRYKALYGGSEKVGKNYIKVGQNTLYLQKFDVDNTDGVLYWHQYMQNLLAAANEGKSVKKGYMEMGVLENAFVFSVPIYKNMPAKAIKIPTDTLETPTLKTSIKQFTEVTLNWSEIAGAQGYEIYRSTKETGGYKKIETLTSVGILNWQQTIETNKIYYYKVRGYKTFLGVTAYSDFSPVKMVSSIIPVPENSAIKQNSYKKVTISWEKAKNVTGYEIYRKIGTSGIYENIVDIKSSNTLSYEDTMVVPKNTYFYKIRSYKVLDGKKHYSEFGVEQNILIRMDIPVLSSVLLSGKTNLTVNWEQEKWVNGYQIYRADSMNGTYQLLEEVKGQKNITFTDETTEADSTYYYKVRSYINVDDGKKYSAFSNVILGEIKMTTPMFKPEYTATVSQITLRWNKNPIAQGYEIQQKDGKKWITVANIKKNASSKAIKGLQAGSTYQFRIRAYKTIDDKTYSSAYSYLKTTTAPEKATIISVQSNKKQDLRVNWNTMEQATGYQVQVSLHKNFKEVEKYHTAIYELKKVTTKVKHIKELVSGKKYYARVRAYRKLGDRKIYGEWSTHKSMVIK